MSFTIFQNKKTPFQAIKTRSSKKSKNRHFSKRVKPWFWSKNGRFFNFSFLGNIGKENVFYNILHRKNAFFAYKTKSSKSRKTEIFPKGLTNSFGSKFAIFPSFFFRQYRPGKCLFTIFQDKKPPFQAIKTTSSKRSEN